jgi:hypothetical protein
MPVESDRTTSVRRITNPDDDTQYVDLHIIDGLSFIDPKDNYQETQFTYDNSADSSRQGDAFEVVGTEDPTSKVKVERTSRVAVLDPNDRYQETQQFWNNTADTPNHLKTHDVKVYARDSSGNRDEDTWLKLRRIDQASLTDPNDHYQETIFELVWDDADPDTGSDANLPDPDKTWDGTSINPPWRLDPWQTIIDVNWGGGMLLVLYGGNKVAAWPASKLKNPLGLGAPSYTATLASSSWGATRIKLAQLRPAKKACFVYSALKITNSTDAFGNITGILSAETNCNLSVIAPGSALDQFISTQLSRHTNPSGPTAPTGTPLDGSPLFNATATKIYTPFDTLAWDGTNFTTIGSASVLDAMPYSIGADGKRYYALNHPAFLGLMSNTPGDNAAFPGTGFQPGALSPDALYGVAADGGDVSPAYDDDTHLNVLTQSGGIDILASSGVLSASTETTSAVIGSWWNGASYATPADKAAADAFLAGQATYSVETGDAAIFDYAVSFTSTVIWKQLYVDGSPYFGGSSDFLTGYMKSLGSVSDGSWFAPGFPFATGATLNKAYLIEERGTTIAAANPVNYAWSNTGSIYAPGRKIDFTWTQSTYGGDPTPDQFPYHDVFDGWLHASNGKHVIQGYCVATAFAHDASESDAEPPGWTPYLTCDGISFGDALASALGTTLADIQTIMLDVPLGRIKQFI